VFHVGGHFFLNKMNQKLLDDPNKIDTSTTTIDEKEHGDDSMNDTFEQENSIDYLPNELKFTTKFFNENAEMILQGPDNNNKQMITEFFRGITLCNQASVEKDPVKPDMFRYICVLHDEIASLEFA
jgi:hypothetical protein